MVDRAVAGRKVRTGPRAATIGSESRGHPVRASSGRRHKHGSCDPAQRKAGEPAAGPNDKIAWRARWSGRVYRRKRVAAMSGWRSRFRR